MIRELKVALGLDTSGFKKGMAEAGAAAKKTEQSFGGLTKAAQGFAATITAGAIVAGMKKAMEAQAAQEDAINKLNRALANQGNYSAKTSKSLQEYASALQDASTYGDEVTTQSMSILASFGQNEEQIKRTTSAAADFAAATGTDLRSAIDLLGKAYAGNTGMLSRYGIIVDENLSKSEKFESAVAQLEKRFGGAASDATKTFSGALAQLKNAIGDVWETLGKFLGFVTSSGDKPFAGLISAAKALQKFFGQDLILAFSELKAQIAEALAWIAEKAGVAFDLLGKLPGGQKYKVMGDQLALVADGLRDQAAAYREAGNVAAMSAGNIQQVTNGLATTTGAATEAQKALNEEMAKLSGAAAQKEIDLLAQAVAGLGGRVADVDALKKKISELAKAGATVPQALQGFWDPLADANRKFHEEAQESYEKLVDAAKKGADEVTAKIVANAMEVATKLGPTTGQVEEEYGKLQQAVGFRSGGVGVSGLNNAELTSYIEQMEKLADTGKFTEEQWLALGDAYTEATKRGIIGTQQVVTETENWSTALEGVMTGAALLAGALGAEFEQVLGVIENIGQSIQSVDWGARNEKGGWLTGSKFNAIAGGVGQVGGLIGGTAGAAIKGAAGGAMTGFAMGGPIGAAVGGAVGLISGIFGAKKKKREEEKKRQEEEKKAIEGMTDALKEQYGSLLNASTAASRYGVDLKAALDSKKAEPLEKALKDLEKRMAGMKKAVEGAARIATYTAGTPGAAQAQGALFGSVFWAAVKTEGLTKAAEALGEPFEAMWEKASDEMRTLLAPIRQQIDLARNESFAAAAEGAAALADIVTGLSDAGVISVNDLTNASVLAMDQYNQALAAAQEQGLTGSAAQEAAIRAVGPAIAEIIAQYEALGLPLDENLQKLKETAEANGMLFPQEPMERAAEAMERVAGALEKAFGLSTGLADNMDRVGNSKPPHAGGNPTGLPEESYATGTKGPVLVKKDMIARVHAGEGLMVIPKNEMATGGFAYGSFARGVYDDDYDRRVPRDDDGLPTAPSPTPTPPTPTEIKETLAASVAELLPQIQRAVATAAPVTIAPQITVNEDPEGDKETRMARRRQTVNEVADAFRRREPALMVEARRALGER